MKRREFLKRFSQASELAIVASATYSLPEKSKWAFNNGGFRIAKPDGYLVQTAGDVFTNHTEEGLLTPVIQFSKYLEPTPRPNPSIVVFIDEIPVGNNDSSDSLLSTMIDSLAPQIDQTLGNPISKDRIGGQLASVAETNYSFEDSYGSTFEILHSYILLRFKGYLYVVMMIDMPENERAIFSDFVSNIEFHV